MINNSNNFNLENGCNYYQNNSMTIQGNNIYVDGFKYYKYSVNDKIIKNYNNSTLLTFVSNNLNRSAFGVSYTDENDTFLKVDIENRNREFYFKLINDLVIHKLINGKIYDTIILNRTHNLNINEPFYNLSFFIEKGNYDLYIDYITRTKQNWENVENNTLYYFFNRVFNFSFIKTFPSVFAFHSHEKKIFSTNITFPNEALMNSLINDLKKNMCNNTNIYENTPIINCTLNTSFLTKNETDRVYYNLSSYQIIIDFIYFELNVNSTCVTLKEQSNRISLITFVPDKYYLDQVYLSIFNNRYTDQEQKTINFSLDINDISFLSTKLFLSNNRDLQKEFYLTDLGVKFIPTYIFNQKDSTIILLPQKDQQIILTYNNYDKENIRISSFNIENLETKNLTINENSISIIFDLSPNLFNNSKDEYSLNYVNECGQIVTTGVTIKVVYFHFSRHYFIKDNNNNQQNSQNLQIQGLKGQQIELYYSTEDKVENKIYTYDSNTGIYNLTLTKTGTYDFFYLSNDGFKNPIPDKVYVYNQLSELFKNNTNFSECMLNKDVYGLYFNFEFLYEKNSDSEFLMTFVNENEYNLTKTSGTKTLNFSLSYNDKGEISENKTLLIYFTENNDKEFPLYLYKYKYTNITLNSIYKDVIFSDALYLLFNMSCSISNIKNFSIFNTSKVGDIECISLEPEEENKVYKCNLNQENSQINPFIGNLKNQYYTMKYDSNYPVVEKEFYFSKDIKSSIFRLKKEDTIYPFHNTTFQINSTDNMFYMPYVDNIRFLNYSTQSQYFSVQNNFEGNFTEQNNFISLSLYIGNKSSYYNLTQICRKYCSYCSEKNSCKDLSQRDEYKISVNIPEINFLFNRHYISIHDSYYNNVKSPNLIITFSGSDKDKLESIIRYCIYKDSPFSNCKENKTFEVNKDGENNFPITEKGLYKFYFKANDNNNFYAVPDVIIVVNDYHELLNIFDINNTCLHYENNVLFTSITIEKLYQNNASNALNDLSILFGNSNFYYLSSSNGYILRSPGSFSCNEGNEYDFSIIEGNNGNVVFTKSSFTKHCTNLELVQNLFKDNLVLLNQNCLLSNTYLKENNYPYSEGELDCNYNGTEKMSYCNFKQTMNRPNITYNFGFKYGDNFLRTPHQLNVFNSIKESDFDVDLSITNLTITSSNFDMRNLSEVYIDNSSYAHASSFKYISSNTIILYYSILDNDTSVHQVTKVLRSDNKYDRPDTIKHKDLDIIIKGIECPEFQIRLNSQCWTCAELIKKGDINSNQKWYQNGRCVEKCDYSLGYGIYNEINFYCMNCTNDRTRLRDENGEYYYLCSCLVGTVRSFEDGVCYLPEMDGITKLTDIQRNAQCFKADGKTHNYCYNSSDPNVKHTRDCVIESINGYFFPRCICEDGFDGKYCEFDKRNIDLTSNMSYILSNGVSPANIAIIANIRAISYFLETDGDKYMTQFSESQISLYINSSVSIVEDIVNLNRSTVPQIFDVLEMAIYFLYYRIRNGKSLRNLQEVTSAKNNLTYILKYLHYVNAKANSNSKSNYKIQSDKLDLTTFIVYKIDDLNDESFKLELANSQNFKFMEYVNMSVSDENSLIFVTLINNKLFDTNQGNNNGFQVSGYFSTTEDFNSNTMKDKVNFILHISSSSLNFNFHLAEYYNTKNIKIYDKNDEAFTDPCFLSEEFDFDLTQKFRKNNVFQKVNYGNDVCKYISFDYKYMRINFLCNRFSYVEQSVNLYYGVVVFDVKKESIEDADKVYHLPTKCSDKINNIGSNWGFWFFLFICVIELLYCIGIGVLTFGSLRKISFRKGLINDDLYKEIGTAKDKESNEDTNSNSVQLQKYDEKIKNKRKNQIDYDENDNNSVISVKSDMLNRNLKSCILHNFKELYPLATLCRVSVLSPLILNSIFFVFNTLVLFGFNALIYYESLIEERIFDKNRNNFDYPMRKEFHKIILSILCQVALCIIMKLILLVTLKQRNQLIDLLKSCKLEKHQTINNGILTTIKDFQDQMFVRRIISSSLMAIIIIFFFYYSIAFCGVYIQTQRNWFFSGIWSLFWNWVIFAPIYIVVISLIEHKKQDINDSTVYYMKRLFCF